MESSAVSWSQGVQLLSWLAREPCVQNPDAVARAWEVMAPAAPTLADCGRMYAAYGRSFSVAQLRYIAQHSAALLLARWAASGWPYLRFNEDLGFTAGPTYVELRPGQVTPSFWAFCFGTVTIFSLAVAAFTYGKTSGGVGGLVLAAICLAFLMLEFVDLRSRHHARRAIALCAAGPHADSMTIAVMPTRGFGLKDSVF